MVQAQTGLPRLVVRAVALKAMARQNGANIAGEIGGGGAGRLGGDQQRKKTAADRLRQVCSHRKGLLEGDANATRVHTRSRRLRRRLFIARDIRLSSTRRNRFARTGRRLGWSAVFAATMQRSADNQFVRLRAVYGAEMPTISTRTPEGDSLRCPLCGEVSLEASLPTGDVPTPRADSCCGCSGMATMFFSWRNAACQQWSES